MSGIYIKGMEMPKSCMACQWSRTDITNTDWCVLTEKDLPCDCPLVAVPDHGRLIDADALHEHMVKVHNEWKEHPELHESIIPVVDDEVMILYFPTIIPADKEGAE